MAGIKSMVVMVVLVVLASFQLQSTVAQTSLTQHGASQTSESGDNLVFFNFTTGVHNVQEVSQSAYGPCTVANPISTETNGPATITLRTAGNHYYICAFGTHCQAGQKVTVNVVGGSTPTPPASTSPAPAGSPIGLLHNDVQRAKTNRSLEEEFRTNQRSQERERASGIDDSVGKLIEEFGKFNDVLFKTHSKGAAYLVVMVIFDEEKPESS
ncbi:cucumber peeling cupredoxin-like protein [Tanacetum coccineum]